jgi:hypothetical protein
MGYSDFPNGATSFGVPVIGGGGSSLVPFTTGNYWWVDSGHGNTADAANHGKKPSRPFATIDYAIGKCTASNGDVIIVAPGHTETISAASGITADVAGITIVGLGNGGLRPIITFSATASTFVISAANVTVKNIITTISIDEVVSMFSITGADVTLDGVDFRPYGAIGATGQAIQFAAITGARCTIQNCTHRQYTAANSAQVWITTAAADGHKILNNSMFLTANASTSSHWLGSSGIPTNIEVVGNRVLFLGATITGVITLSSGATGIICDNRLASGTSVATATAIVADAAYVAENYWIDDAAASAILTPAAGTD